MKAILALTLALGCGPLWGAQDDARLARLVRHDCGSCHGLRLTGGLGPALTSTALHGKPAAYVQAVILNGRAGTAMPPWSPFLTHAEAAWIAERLLEGFPDAP
jgi:cytochrome c55X